MKRVKYLSIIILITILLTYKGTFIKLLSNINLLTSNISNKENIENYILKEKIKKLENDIKDITKLKSSNFNYKLTKFSYYDTYKKESFYITNGLDNKIKEGNLIINEYGLVGIVNKVYKDYSKIDTIKKYNNISIKINNEYGTIKKYENNLFIVEDISNISNIKLNDLVFTIPTKEIKNEVLVGYVKDIEIRDINKVIYIKSDVDFNNINYLYVIGE